VTGLTGMSRGITPHSAQMSGYGSPHGPDERDEDDCAGDGTQHISPQVGEPFREQQRAQLPGRVEAPTTAEPAALRLAELTPGREYVLGTEFRRRG